VKEKEKRERECVRERGMVCEVRGEESKEESGWEREVGRRR
jgi:hypothetical protein